MIPDVVKTADRGYQIGVLKITSVNTVCEVMFSEVDKLLKMYSNASKYFLGSILSIVLSRLSHY